MKFDHFGIGIAKGMAVTLKNLFRRPVTVQYPEQRLNTSRRIRGNELVWSKEKCTGCATCAKACPQGVINIETSANPDNNKYEVKKYEVDTGYCIFCALCVEACPFNALYMGYDYERARYRRGELVQSRDMMTETPEKHVSGYFFPDRAASLPLQTLLVEKITEEE
ncbi:MAG: NADH-quinone oxidoreductase subunit I [Chloroflexi bacterium]|nr:NADH-quinone oxidoreductase subunit I [Chloroflexota bacterium]